MPKPITFEMLQAMSPDQRKILHRNASALDSQAARDVIELLAHDDLMGPPKVAPTASPRKKAPAKPKAAPKAAPKPKTASFGRQG